MKANLNLIVLQVFTQLDAGFDTMSADELKRVLAAGAPAAKVMFSGVGRSADETRFALKVGMMHFNMESIPKLHRLNDVTASTGKVTPVPLRTDPDMDVKTHPYVPTGLRGNELGVTLDEVLPIYRAAAAVSNLRVAGIDCHIGSQITEVPPYLGALDEVLDVVTQLDVKGIRLAHIDVGDGPSITYADGAPPDITAFMRALLDRVRQRSFNDHTVLFELGQPLVGSAGLLFTRVGCLKPGASKNLCTVNAAMNDLTRPVMYEAYHHIVPVRKSQSMPVIYDAVGPTCESDDWLGRNRSLAVQPGNVFAVLSVGAYGFTINSNYNTCNRAAEVIAGGDKVYLVHERKCFEDLIRGEYLLPA